ncbi:MAG: hypothetical protein NXI26_10470, partial [bacterium]|nr:hypothetical protein [bacterium]
MLLLTTASPLSAQLLLQEGFEVESCVPVNLNCEPGLTELVDANNCLNGWSRWHGSPNISINNNPPEGTQALRLRWDLPENFPPNIFSEGVIANLPSGLAVGD